MSDYAIKNLKSDVEDAAPKFGMSPAVEARFATRVMGGDTLGLSYQKLGPNVRMPFGHKHGRQEEVYVVVEGSGRVRIDDETHDVKQWDAVRVSADTMRAFEAGDDGLTFLAIGAPIGQENDAELEQGWWSD